MDLFHPMFSKISPKDLNACLLNLASPGPAVSPFPEIPTGIRETCLAGPDWRNEGPTLIARKVMIDSGYCQPFSGKK